MPCDVRRIVRLRLRAHGDDVVAEALARWESVDTTTDDLAKGRERLPLDARIWLSPWPLVLVDKHVERRSGGTIPVVGEALAPSEAPIIVALARLERIDPAGFMLVVERARGTLDALAWRSALGESDVGFESRIARAVYRLLVLRAGILAKIDDPRARVCLAAKYFRAGEASEFACLRAARKELGEPDLSISAFRALEIDGARSSLALLAKDPQLSVLLDHSIVGTIRYTLRLDGDDAEPIFSPEALTPVFMMIDREIEESAPRTPDAHPSLRDLAWFAAAESPRDKAVSYVEHLLVCRDRRCVELFRGEVCGREAVTRALSGPMSDPPPSFASMGGPALASPHMIRCRDVLWETFTAMAKAEGRDVDELVEEAMDRYRALRTHVRASSPGLPSAPIPEPPPTRRESTPPPAGGNRAGLRLGMQSWPPSDDPLAFGSAADDASIHDATTDLKPHDAPTLLTPIDDITKKRDP